jgi:hypothetical protein
MPIWLRRFTFEKIKEFYEKEREEAEKQQNMMNNKNSKGLSRPNIAPSSKSSPPPTYTVKAPRK